MICKITTSCGSLMLTPYLKTVIRRKMQYNVEIVANQTILIPKIYPLATFHIHNPNTNAAIFPHFTFCSGFLFLLEKIGFF